MPRKPMSRKERLSPKFKENEHSRSSTEQALAKLRRVQGHDNQGSDSKPNRAAGENADES
ncbi:hypothetical protein P5_0023 [Aeromonas phage P5]|nr:hypothetical protein P5_0023 [Aeromonas phage P5]